MTPPDPSLEGVSVFAMLPVLQIYSGNPTPESKSLPAGPSPDQPRSEGSQVLKKGAWEEKVKEWGMAGSQCLGQVAAKGVRWAGAGSPCAAAVRWHLH